VVVGVRHAYAELLDRRPRRGALVGGLETRWEFVEARTIFA
jgi:hypothetical protein